MIRIVNVGKEPPQSMDGHQPLWLITFADLIGLLLVFFVLLFSMSSLEQSKLQSVTQGLAGIHGTSSGDADAVNRQLPDPQVQEGRDPGYLTSVIKAKFDSVPALRPLAVHGFGDRAVITLPQPALQSVLISGDTGGRDGVLYALADVLRVLPNQIIVDSKLAPMTATGDRAVWAQSLRAAMVVGQALANGGVGGTISTRGHVAATGEQPGIDIVVLSTTAPAGGDNAATGDGPTGGGDLDTQSADQPNGARP
ncbi:MAG: flagellar motor protein MotB [Dongiaceae bacterium]